MPVSTEIIIHYIGITCSSIVIFIFMILSAIDISYVNRVTVRLVAGIAIADLIGHTASILTLESLGYVGATYCKGLSAMTNLSRFMYSLTNIAICYHLYRVIVLLKKPSFKHELTVWIILMLVTGLFMLMCHFLGIFSGTLNKKLCVPGADNRSSNIVSNVLLGIVHVTAIVSGIFITWSGHKYINQWIGSYSDKKIRNTEYQERFKSKKRKAAHRSFLYPLSTIITLSFETVVCFWNLAGTSPEIVRFLNRYTSGFKGILTLAAFIIDPAVCDSINSAYNKVKNMVKDPNRILKEPMELNNT